MARFALNWHELEKELLKRFDTQLATKKFVTSDKMSWVDFCLFCELYQIGASYNTQLPSDYTHLNRWFEEMKSVEALI